VPDCRGRRARSTGEWAADRNQPRSVYDRRRREPTEEALVLEIVVEPGEGYVLCRPVGELDAYTVAQFREALIGLAEHQYVLIDLSEVPFMDSAGLIAATAAWWRRQATCCLLAGTTVVLLRWTHVTDPSCGSS